jgi:hypothetical protein
MRLFGEPGTRVAACSARARKCARKCECRVTPAHGAAGRRGQSSLAWLASLMTALAVVGACVADIGTAWAQAPDGAACATSADCSSGTCNNATGLCSRRTAAGAPDGAACGRNSECHSGICNSVTRQCSPRARSESPPATDRAEGSACAGDADCSSGNCDLAARVCRPKAAAAESPEGTSCSTNADCRSGRCNAATGLCTRR